MPLRPGDLRDLITVMRKTSVPNVDAPGYHDSWAPVGDPIWAQVLGINGREAVIGQALEGVSYYKIVVRAGADVTEADQLVSDDPAVFGGKALNISGPPSDPDGRREQLLILANTGSVQAMSNG